MRFFSKGILRRLYLMIEAAFNQGDVNHVTGDIHFVALLLNRKRTLLTIHDLGFVNHPNRLLRFILKMFWLKLPVQRSTIITTVSEKTREEVIKHTNVNPSKVKVVHVPVSAGFIAVPREFNKSEPFILQIGTKYNKNLSRLIAALKGLPSHLEIIGQPDKKVMNQLNLSGIKFHVSVNLSAEEMRQMYVNADIVSFVSTNEGFGMPIIEANATGRVVITSNISSMPEVASNAAHYVDPFDVNDIRLGIIRVTEDNAYREELIANGYLNCQRFNLNRITKEYEEIYHKLYNQA